MSKRFGFHGIKRSLLCAVAAAAALAGTAAPVPAADVTTITQCGETVPAGVTAYLQSDLDCRGAGVEGVVLSNRSRLVLSGFSIVGDPAETASDGSPLQGVRCEAGTVCTIEGPGSVAGFSASGVAGTRVRIRDVEISGNAKAGVSAFENVKMTGVVIGDNGTLAVHAGGRVRATDVDLGDRSSDVVEWRAPSLRPSGPRS